MIFCSTPTWAITRSFLDRNQRLRSSRHNGCDDSCFGKAREAMSKYRAWAALYPDDFAAYSGYAINAFGDNAYADGLAFLGPALSPRNPSQGHAWYLQGSLLLALNRYAEAKSAFARRIERQ